MKRLFLPFLSLCVLGSVSCQTNDSDVESATVQPSDPQSISGQGNSGGMKKTYSGLQYEVLRPGKGQRPTEYNRVRVHYHGTLQNGTVFDSSVQRGQPTVLGLNQVIPGWREGIPLMKEGAKYRFIVPPHLAYGARGAPPKIGPNETLIFEVELIEVL
ncbi:MAG: FKBP-type peptidyl-prolyl cis-trans isomerase [Verrucomicrobiales bacterium]|jgi:FKBP-type peptidyl-prolyl cis-trans isomerase|nr:FKBP-type peptidyl-prolyl cis-trans isomerase [Verrucomicrobiales bacterium]